MINKVQNNHEAATLVFPGTPEIGGSGCTFVEFACRTNPEHRKNERLLRPLLMGMAAAVRRSGDLL